MSQRRFLPPLPWLSAFEAVARLGSVTQAAAELDLSQGAVSRQIQKLEDQLGANLFQRVRKRLLLTPAGHAYATDIRGAITVISNASIRAATNPHGGTLELAILPAFGTHWLAPRLPGFLDTHPGITLNLSTRTAPFDFAGERFHAAIHFGRKDWPGADAVKLMEEDLVPVVAPGMLPERAGARDLASLPLLHLETRRRAWASWFKAQDLSDTPRPGMVFDQFATMEQAAVAGLGAALLPRYLAQSDLDAGRLITLAGVNPTIVGAYFLVWPPNAATYPPLVAFRNWIGGIAKNPHPSNQVR